MDDERGWRANTPPSIPLARARAPHLCNRDNHGDGNERDRAITRTRGYDDYHDTTYYFVITFRGERSVARARARRSSKRLQISVADRKFLRHTVTCRRIK